MIVLPAMPEEQTASWLGLLELYDNLPEGWTLIGGQLVHLHCAERGQFPERPTNDADTLMDVRANPTILSTFTKALTDLGFRSAGVSAEGRQHRWVRDTTDRGDNPSRVTSLTQAWIMAGLIRRIGILPNRGRKCLSR